jgi:hypothetical protein
MIVNIKDIKRTDFNLAWQHTDTIKRFNKVIDNKYDFGSAELLYQLSKVSYKRQFWDFCCRNHLKIVVDDINSEQERYKEWRANQPSNNIIEEPETYGDATMRHSS